MRTQNFYATSKQCTTRPTCVRLKSPLQWMLLRGLVTFNSHFVTTTFNSVPLSMLSRDGLCHVSFLDLDLLHPRLAINTHERYRVLVYQIPFFLLVC